jgi:hypothetical protein
VAPILEQLSLQNTNKKNWTPMIRQHPNKKLY